MAKGQFLTSHQKGIVNRYYATADTRVVTTLQELVSDLALAETDAAKTKLWKKAADNLAKTTLDPKRAAAILEKRDVKTFAIAVAELSSAPTALKPSTPRKPTPALRRPLTPAMTPAKPIKQNRPSSATQRVTPSPPSPSRHSLLKSILVPALLVLSFFILLYSVHYTSKTSMFTFEGGTLIISELPQDHTASLGWSLHETSPYLSFDVQIPPFLKAGDDTMVPLLPLLWILFFTREFISYCRSGRLERRSRSEQCLSCGYELRSLPQCPECGARTPHLAPTSSANPKA